MNDAASYLTLWHWLGFAAILLVSELIFSTSCFLLALGVSAAFVAMVLKLTGTLSWPIQALIFAAGSIVSLAVWYKYLTLHSKTKPVHFLNKRGMAHIGELILLEQPVVNHKSKVCLSGVWWVIEGQNLAQGMQVKVTGMVGMNLKVELIK